MAAPPKAWKAEYAKSGRASCKSCRSPIAKDQLRLGKMVQATQFDGFMPVRNPSLPPARAGRSPPPRSSPPIGVGRLRRAFVGSSRGSGG